MHPNIAMNKKTSRRSLLALVLASGLGLGVYYTRPMLRIGTGYATKMICSCTFIQDRDPAEVRAQELNFSILSAVETTVDREAKTVTGSFYGIVTRKAQFIPGRGCVLIADPDIPLPTAWDRPASPTTWNWPSPPDSILTTYDQEALDSAFAYGMRPLSGGGARALVLIHRGKLIREVYGEGFTAETPQLGWSMAKSLTGALTGVLVGREQLHPNQQGLFEAWSNDVRSNIHLADLLHMNSGLDWEESYGSATDATRMLYLEPNFSAYAMAKPSIAQADTRWVYSSGTSNLIAQLHRNQFTDVAEYLRFPYDALFHPLGIQNAYFEPDQNGTLVGSSYAWLRPRDWAKVGQLYLQNGRWEGRQLLPADWVDYSRQPAEGSEGAYGAQIWLKTEDLPDAPDDIFAFRGFQDQRVFIIPSRDLVFVRLGRNDDKTEDFNELLVRVLAALPN